MDTNITSSSIFALFSNVSTKSNRTFILGNWTRDVIGCSSWSSPNHALFQLANCVIMIGLLAPTGKKGALFLRGFLVFGFLLMSVWSWVLLCAIDFFIWNVSFTVVNVIQALYLMYNVRTIKFCDELEEVYAALFEPIRVPRHIFKKMVSTEYCTLASLHDGEYYATHGISKTDKLGLLISGKMTVYSHTTLLHQIGENEFIDSPEFESSACGEEKYQVSIIASTACRYLFWSRQNIEYLLNKESYLANVFSIILGRDITNKLYALNEKVLSPKGSKLDIRLPNVSSTLKARKDLRKTMAGVGVESTVHALATNVTSDDDVNIDESEETENTDLLNGHVRQVGLRSQRLSTCSEYSRGSHGSRQCSINSYSSNSESAGMKITF